MSTWPDNCKDCGIHRNDMPEPPRGTFIKKERGIENAIQCKACHEKEIAEKIRIWQEFFAVNESVCEYTDDIICPHCGEKHEQDGESSEFYVDGTHEFDCGYCGEEFRVDTSVSYSYSSYKTPE